MANKNKMPWDDLIDAFLEDAPTRNKQIARSGFKRGLVELREFRVLTIGGPRQTGKSKAGARIVQEHPEAYMLGGWTHSDQGKFRQIKIPAEKSLELHELKPAKLADVKILVIENDFSERSLNYYKALEQVYAQRPEWFHPEFSVIRILCPVTN